MCVLRIRLSNLEIESLNLDRYVNVHVKAEFTAIHHDDNDDDDDGVSVLKVVGEKKGEKNG